MPFCDTKAQPIRSSGSCDCHLAWMPPSFWFGLWGQLMSAGKIGSKPPSLLAALWNPQGCEPLLFILQFPEPSIVPSTQSSCNICVWNWKSVSKSRAVDQWAWDEGESMRSGRWCSDSWSLSYVLVLPAVCRPQWSRGLEERTQLYFPETPRWVDAASIHISVYSRLRAPGLGPGFDLTNKTQWKWHCTSSGY